MVKKIEITKYGAPEVMDVVEADELSVGADEVLVRHTAVGLNELDVLARSGFLQTELPFTPGHEACGIVEEIGANVQNFSIGERVAYVHPDRGAYSEARTIHQNLLISIPDYVDDDDVAACLMKGMTAHYLTRRTFFVRKNNYLLLQGASEGVGLLICQMSKQYDAKLIATVTQESHKEVVQQAGAGLVLNSNDPQMLDKIQEYTKGEGVSVAYDLIGKDTIDKSQKALSEFGLLVCAGFTSGMPDPILFKNIYSKSSFVTCPNYFHYKADKMEVVLSANEIFAQLQKKLIKPHFFKKYHLKDVVEAHQDIESGKQFGQSIIVV
ncbi:MAG: zinc-binding dehydrogenase [Rickettsiales bacterium]